MHYFIDGYNLMFRVMKAGKGLSSQREILISELNLKARLLNLDFTLVFDAHHRLGSVSRGHYDQLEILFTGEGETADEYILRELTRDMNPSQQTVVTSDKKLAWLSRRRQAHTETVEKFLEWLDKRYKNKWRRYRQAQKEAIEVPKLAPKTTSPSGTSSLAPKHTAKPEECFEYYLETFEKGLKENFEINLISSSLKKIPLAVQISDQERWLAAFTRLLQEGEEK
jgi:predicted RNA-binding protein with PIN domain